MSYTTVQVIFNWILDVVNLFGVSILLSFLKKTKKTWAIVVMPVILDDPGGLWFEASPGK
jgi:hypothetical protein